MMRAAVLAALLPFFVAPASAQIRPVKGGVRADGIAAVVGAHAPVAGADVILQSDVELRARMHLAGRVSEGTTTARPSRGLLRASLDELVGEVLIAREASRVRVSVPSDEAIERERRRLQRLAGGPERLSEVLHAMGASPAEVEAMARRRATVQAFLNANLEGSTVVTDGELQRVHEAGEHPFVGKPLDDVRDALRAWISRQALERAVRRWVAVLRERTTVRVLAPYGAAAEE
ncbi:MAG: hypothetical protein ACODAU_02195 [Myxococcota bacterium]